MEKEETTEKEFLDEETLHIDTSEKFKIGEYTFSTLHEYRDAQEDVRKIEIIKEELDIQDPEVAVRLYNMIRDGEITFRSPVGENFFDHVADIVADKSVGLLEDHAVVGEAEHKVRFQKYIGMAVVSLAAVLFVYFGFSEIENYLTTRRLAKISEQTKEHIGDAPGGVASSEQARSIDDDPFAKEKVDPNSLVVLPEYQVLLERNPDMAGWIEIPDTEINYPVVKRANDNAYYLNKDFDKNEDSNGTIFMDYRNDIANPSTNTILYGHNMNSGLMFGGLKKYLDEDYYHEHEIVNFSTIYEKKQYKIVAVCLAQVEYQDDDSFRYYNFINADNEGEWNAFTNNISQLSVFSSSVSLLPGDEVLTLSTCNNYTEDGRLFLVAKRIG
ncbi:MAG: class B sortase [Lachnospiraceae bacterium]|nr:class B sortase [Lachnospiraceae bacterium]